MLQRVLQRPPLRTGLPGQVCLPEGLDPLQMRLGDELCAFRGVQCRDGQVEMTIQR